MTAVARYKDPSLAMGAYQLRARHAEPGHIIAVVDCVVGQPQVVTVTWVTYADDTVTLGVRHFADQVVEIELGAESRITVAAYQPPRAYIIRTRQPLEPITIAHNVA